MTVQMLTYDATSLGDLKFFRLPTMDEAEMEVMNLAEAGVKAVVFETVEDLAKSAMGTTLIRFYNYLSPKPDIKKFKNNTIGATRLWELLLPITENGPLTLAAKDTTTSEPDADKPLAGTVTDTPLAETSEGETDMAAKKKAKAKAKKTPKVKDGQPRTGSKKAELLRLLSRASGATMAEMLAATGWKACLGTAKAVTESAGKKFRCEKSESGKGATRWYAE